MRAKRQPLWGLLYVLTLVLIFAVYFHATRAMATEKPADKPTQTQSQNMTQGNAQTVNAGGGQGGGASNQLSMGGDKTTAVAFGTTASIPYGDVPRCYLPARGIKRVRSALWGLVDLGAVVQRDDACMADLAAERAHELAVIQAETARAQAEADAGRVALDRIKADDCDTCRAARK